MKVTSNKTISFPSLGWGINAGEVRDLPEDAKAQETILASKYIKEVGQAPSTDKPESKPEPTKPKDESDQKSSSTKTAKND